MKKLVVMLDTIEKVKKFVSVASRCDGDIDLMSERYVVDAKSIMGIFSLDLGAKLTLNVYNDADYDALYAEIKDFVVE